MQSPADAQFARSSHAKSSIEYCPFATEASTSRHAALVLAAKHTKIKARSAGDKASRGTASLARGFSLADLGGLVCGLHSRDAALKVPSTSLSTSSAIPIRVGAEESEEEVGEGRGGCKSDNGSQSHRASGERGCADCVGSGGFGGSEG